MLLTANLAIFQLYHGKNKLIFNEMMMRSALYQTNMLSWIFIVLAHWNNSQPVRYKRGSNLVVFYYLSTSEIWIDKRDGFGGSGHLRWESTVVDLLGVAI